MMARTNQHKRLSTFFHISNSCHWLISGWMSRKSSNTRTVASKSRSKVSGKYILRLSTYFYVQILTVSWLVSIQRTRENRNTPPPRPLALRYRTSMHIYRPWCMPNDLTINYSNHEKCWTIMLFRHRRTGTILTRKCRHFWRKRFWVLRVFYIIARGQLNVLNRFWFELHYIMLNLYISHKYRMF